jgi:putative FmdB family regulatory protein
MPTYEYVCKECGDTVEVFQSFSERPLKKHKTCGGELKKVFHSRGIVFKGNGFYATDRKGSGTTKTASDGDSDPKPKKESKKDKAPSHGAGVGSKESSRAAATADAD